MAKKRLNRSQFKVTNQKGRLIQGAFFSAKIQRLENGLGHRFSVVVSGRIDKRAVVRNRLKRRLYAILEVHKAAFPKDFALILFTKGTAARSTYQELEKGVREFIGHIR